VEDLVQPVRVEGCQTLYVLKHDTPILESMSRDHSPDGVEHTVRLLAPLDPLIYDRTLTARLWNFDYTWEAYTPPAKRHIDRRSRRSQGGSGRPQNSAELAANKTRAQCCPSAARADNFPGLSRVAEWQQRRSLFG
jgi:hypothetical protein